MQLIHSIFFYFIIYSFFGWIIEGLFNLLTRGTFLKPNFLMLPLKPMYGIAATLLIYLKALLPIGLFLISALILPTLVEYLTAELLFRCYTLKYWDYSHCSHQYKGYICLRFSIYWFVLCIVLAYGLQPYIALFYNAISWFWHPFFPVAVFIFLLDLLLTLYHRYMAKQPRSAH